MLLNRGMKLSTSMSTTSSQDVDPSLSDRLLARAAAIEPVGIAVLRTGLVIVLLWIGGLKFANYEADSIVPLVANSPFASFLYAHPAPEYHQYMNKEGEAVPAHQRWHEGKPHVFCFA